MNTIRVSLPLRGVPETFESEIQKKIYDTLSNLGIEFERVENDPAVTMEDCKAIDNAFGVETIKTVFLTNRQKTKFYLLAMPAEKQFITKDFGSALEIPRVSFADEILLAEKLGTPRGAATPLSILQDSGQEVMVVIDEELLKRDKIVCTDGTLHGFICLRLKDLLNNFFTQTNHQPRIINL